MTKIQKMLPFAFIFGGLTLGGAWGYKFGSEKMNELVIHKTDAMCFVETLSTVGEPGGGVHLEARIDPTGQRIYVRGTFDVNVRGPAPTPSPTRVVTGVAGEHAGKGGWVTIKKPTFLIKKNDSMGGEGGCIGCLGNPKKVWRDRNGVAYDGPPETWESSLGTCKNTYPLVTCTKITKGPKGERE